jgi:hypothetical protein
MSFIKNEGQVGKTEELVPGGGGEGGENREGMKESE